MSAPQSDSNRFPSQVKFIVSNEACERFSYYGMRSILAGYITGAVLQGGLGQTGDRSTEIIHLFVSANYFMPLLGAWLSDKFIGRYHTILWVSLFYCVGHGVLACSDFAGGVDGKLWCLFVGLALIAFGSGGIKPCVSVFMGDQFKPEQSHLLQKAYGAFYWSVNLGSFFSFLVVPWVKNHHGYSWAFGVPGILMAVATLIFWLGTKHYVRVPPSRATKSAGFFKVFWHALTGAKASGEDFWSAARSRFSEREVDAAKSVLPILGVFALVPPFWSLFDQTSSTWVLQGEKMIPLTIDGATLFGSLIALFVALIIVAVWGNRTVVRWVFVSLNGLVLLITGLILSSALIRCFSAHGQSAEGSSTFSMGDFVDLPSLATKLKQPADPVSAYLKGKFSAATLTVLADYQDPSSDPGPLQAALVADFNAIIGSQPIYDVQRFAGITLRPVTQQLLAQNSQGDVLARVNRLLLEDTYPLEISRNRAENLIAIILSFGGALALVTVGLRSPLRLVQVLFGAEAIFFLIGSFVAHKQLLQFSFRIGAEEMQSANPLLVMILVPLLTLLVYPQLGRFASPLRRMSYGMFLGAASYVIVAGLQQRLEAGAQLSVAWQTLPYIVLTAAEVLVSTTGLEFAFREAAPEMKSLITSFWLLTVTAGNLLVAFITKHFSGAGGGESSVSSGRFLMYAALSFVVAILFSVVASFYRYRDTEAAHGR